MFTKKKEIKLHASWGDPYYMDEDDKIDSLKSINYLFVLFENLIYPKKSKIIYPEKCNKELYELLIIFTKILIEYYTKSNNESSKIEYYDTLIFKKSKEIVLKNIDEEITFKDYLLKLIGTIDYKLKISESKSPYLDTLLTGIDTEKIKKDQEEYEKQEKDNLINSYIQKLVNLGYHKNNDIIENIKIVFTENYENISYVYNSNQIEIALKYLVCDLNIDIKNITKDINYIKDKLDFYLKQNYETFNDIPFDFWISEDSKKDILNEQTKIKNKFNKEITINKAAYIKVYNVSFFDDNIKKVGDWEYDEVYNKEDETSNTKIYYITKICFIDLLLYALFQFKNRILNFNNNENEINFCIINLLINFNNNETKSIFDSNSFGINSKSFIINRADLLMLTKSRYKKKLTNGKDIVLPVLELNVSDKNGLISRFIRTLKILGINK